MTMIERVARAIATRHWRSEIDEFKEPDRWKQAEDAYDLTNNGGRYFFDQLAIAAFEAMRVLTGKPEYMVDMWFGAKPHDGYGRQKWGEVIDAALQEGENEIL